jgi:hypothetical protein
MFDFNAPIEWEWEGYLESPIGLFAARSPDTLPSVSIGKPAWWPDDKMPGDKWTPPAGGSRYGLARFAFSLRPDPRQMIKTAEFTLDFSAIGPGQAGRLPRPTAFDLYPQLVTEEQTGSRSIGLDPKFKFGSVAEFSGAKAEVTLNVKQALVVTKVDGLGESYARWTFTARPAHPLTGSQEVYVVVELPPGVEAARASAQLSAEVANPLGPFKGLLPQTEQARFSWVLR